MTQYDCLRLIIALPTQLCIASDQVPIQSTFLHIDVVDQIWMVPSPDIRLDGMILQRNKALYRLKQGLLAWFQKLSQSFLEIVFISPPFDPCVFLSTEQKILVVCIYCQITTARLRSDIKTLKDHLYSEFYVTVNASHKYHLEWQQTHPSRCGTLTTVVHFQHPLTV